MIFELNNAQRLFFGLEPIESNWEKVVLKGDTYRPESILYFDGDIIKRHIVSTENQYKESQYDDLTRSRVTLLPATSKGKERKLTASVLESRQPTGVYCLIETNERIRIGNYNTQTTFYDSVWENHKSSEIIPISALVENFIQTCNEDYLTDINWFKNSKRKNAKFKTGDFFVFKINRTEYGFGRILLNIDEAKKKNLISEHHGLGFLMTKPVLIKVYAHISSSKDITIEELEKTSALPSDYMMDNLFFYGEYKIIGHKDLKSEDLDFPMSHGRHISATKQSVFLQWGLIHLELPVAHFNKYLVAENTRVPEGHPSRKIRNPYGYYSIGFRPQYGTTDIKDTIENAGVYDFQNHSNFKNNFDLRNPQNKEIRAEIMRAFGLDPMKSYDENCELTNTIDSQKLLKIIA